MVLSMPMQERDDMPPCFRAWPGMIAANCAAHLNGNCADILPFNQSVDGFPGLLYPRIERNILRNGSRETR